jgi:hypothetical protein
MTLKSWILRHGKNTTGTTRERKKTMESNEMFFWIIIAVVGILWAIKDELEQRDKEKEDKNDVSR